MTPCPYLCVATIGPIQGFIQAARRTRDLWCGSTLLSEISRTVAKSIQKSGGDLIFPHPESVDRFSVANVVWASFPASRTPEDVWFALDEAEKRAHERWREAAARACDEVREFIVERRWKQQLDDVLEFYAAFLPVPNEAEHPAVRRRLNGLMAARKASRDFQPWAGEAKVPKSSLDGARESVWDPEKLSSMPASLRGRLRLNPGEQLDAIGLAKRLGQGARQFPSVSRVAADAWIRGLEQQDRVALVGACHQLKGRGLITFDTTARFPQYRDFPLKARLFFRCARMRFSKKASPRAI